MIFGKYLYRSSFIIFVICTVSILLLHLSTATVETAAAASAAANTNNEERIHISKTNQQQQQQQEVLADGSTRTIQIQTMANSIAPKVDNEDDEEEEDDDDDNIKDETNSNIAVSVVADKEDVEDVEDDFDLVDEYNEKNTKTMKVNIKPFNGIIPPIPKVGWNGYVQVEYGIRQEMTSSDKYKDCITVLHTMHQYMYGTVYMALYNASAIQTESQNEQLQDTTTTNNYKKIQENCLVRDESCIYWAAIGECDVNPAYMKLHCAPACGTCDQILFENRCPIPSNISDGNIWIENDLNTMFTRIITEPYYKETYGPITILSQPGILPKKSITTEQVMYDDSPWIITIDDFLTKEECTTLIELGHNEGYKRSKEDYGKEESFDGTIVGKRSKDRTSKNAWCMTNNCYNNTITQQILGKIENLTNIPDMYSEHLQILQYTIGQYYKDHHDYIEHHNKQLIGVRIITVFLYLNNVIAGGGTRFTNLNITIMPKRGRVVIWPSVVNTNPTIKDIRTNHEALIVENGIKYSANSWIHLRDFKTPFLQGCV